ncbi:MAG: S8 family serine peptidase [Myxococcota bacterium]
MANDERGAQRTTQFEVVVKPSEGRRSVFEPDSFPTVDNLEAYRPDRGRAVEAARKLQNLGITVHDIGAFSISASCSEARFEEFFSTNIRSLPIPKEVETPEGYEMRAPSSQDPFDVPSVDGLDQLIDRAYIQHAPILFAGERSLPPFWSDKFRLRVPGDVAQIMNASPVHRRGITGKGVRVAMTDTGFYRHPYFVEQGFNFLAVTAPDAVDHTSDSHGHGTGECANLFATAPGINFVGVKMGNPTLAIKTAVELRPQIITNSWGYNVDFPNTGMPNWLKPLHLAVLDAVSRGIVMCFSAGNGHRGFPGDMPEVISVGGVHVDSSLEYEASNYASGYDSTWFPGRRIPDVCGLVGMRPTADYIVLPVQSNAALERPGGNGWGAFSGTSAASPMVAGVCALLKQADPTLDPQQVKDLLCYTARDIVKGTNIHGAPAAPGPDGATGYGLVDAERALEVVL